MLTGRTSSSYPHDGPINAAGLIWLCGLPREGRVQGSEGLRSRATTSGRLGAVVARGLKLGDFFPVRLEIGSWSIGGVQNDFQELVAAVSKSDSTWAVPMADAESAWDEDGRGKEVGFCPLIWGRSVSSGIISCCGQSPKCETCPWKYSLHRTSVLSAIRLSASR
jgi:hypothetical protein